MRLKNLLLIPLIFVITSKLAAQNRPEGYDAKWKVVDSLIDKKGLTQSALEQVNKIYSSAKNERNDAQLIKALVYRMNLEAASQEDVTQQNILALEKELPSVQEPARSILSGLLAGTYLDYLRQNRYKIYGRTATTGIKKEDMATWGADDLHKRIGELYLASIRNEKLLWQTPLASFGPIIVKGNVGYLRPTLFDLLAHQALDYFKSDERDLNQPAYAFGIDDPAAFAGLETFASHSFYSIDSLSLHFQALQLFQRLIRLHLSDTRQAALLDLDLERVRFVQQNGIMDNKEDLYKAALSTIVERFDRPGQPDIGPDIDEARYLQAELYASHAQRYDPMGDTAGRFAYLPAKAICEKVIARKDSSEGNINCRNLLNTILRKDLILETEMVNVPGQPFRSLLSWCNFSKVWFRLVRMDRRLKEGLGTNVYQEIYWTKLLQLPLLKDFSQALPETGDYQQHRAEIKTDALPAGEYALIASADSGFSLHMNALAVQYFYVSSISLINYNNDYFVLNRESGQPLSGAAIQAWDRGYDYRTNAYIITRAETYQADQHGYFSMKDSLVGKANHDRLMEISIPGDHFFPDKPVSRSYFQEGAYEADQTTDKAKYEKQNLKTFFFTDRSIYRPGQTVYFKGIIITRDVDSRRPKILSGLATKVILYDVNDQPIDSLRVTSNEYGSYHGQFSLPPGLLKGQFKLEDDSTGDQQPFSVEEYKRPSFSVDYEKLKGGYRPGDSVHVSGMAKAYAGNPIDGAAVKYRVIRQARFPYRWMFGSGWNPGAGRQEIAHGLTHTDAEGHFSIVFIAIPDKSIQKKLDPVFEYSVEADITDINGETRSGQTQVPVGYKVLELAIDLPQEGHLPAGSLKELTARTSNLSGEPERASVSMRIYKLKAPDRLIRSRYWSQPDQFVMSQEEYLAAFPHDEYSDETKKESWSRESQPVINSVLSTDSLRPGLSVYSLHGALLAPGWYAVEATARDRFGQEVKDLQYLELSDSITGQPASPQYEWASGKSVTVEPGLMASVTTRSSAGGLYVIRKTGAGEDKAGSGDKQGDDAAQPSGSGIHFFTLDKVAKTTQFPITEADRGGFSVSDIFVKDNRYYRIRHVIIVPWTNKELTIGYSSFRDKTLPGSEEKWQLHIAGYKGDKVAAEVLAGMYDASLDAFQKQEWSVPGLYPSFVEPGDWNAENGFSSAHSLLKYENNYVNSYYSKVYDHLLLPRGTRRIMIRGRAMTLGGRSDNDVARVPGNLSLGISRTTDSSVMAFGPQVSKDQVMVVGYGSQRRKDFSGDAAERIGVDEPSGQVPVQVRKNFAETAFFFPDLRTDSAGNVSFSFTMPEALTRWKWMTLAYTKELAFGYSEKSVITSKQLMVQPNVPRFLREGDRLELSARVVNLTDSEMTGQMELQLTDPTTGQSVDGWFSNREANQYFTVGARQSGSVGFSIEIPYQYNRPVTYRLIARARDYSDGEEATLPVVSNRMLVTESLPLNLPGNGTKNFHFDKLLQSGASETLSNHALTVEFTSNPAWYAVQALPYLMEYPYECAEQTFHRLYANALAARIAGSSPRIAQIFAKWKNADTAALLSNLEKDQELKSLLLQETPWVLEGKSETQQKKHIALLFDSARMNRELNASISKLQTLQSPGGGFVWFKGGPDERYITTLILTGIGRLQKLNALPAALADKINALVTNALPYLDGKIKEDFEELKKTNKGMPPGVNGPAVGANGQKAAGAGTGLSGLQAQYLYMRSFFGDRGIPGDVFPALNYYRKQAQQSWLQGGRYMQGMIALALYRTGDVKTAGDIMASLRQNAIRDEEKGMYWKDMRAGYYWYQAPVETQSLLIEAFHEIAPNATIDRDLRTWLLKQKQASSWTTTVATADACYALLIGGPDWLAQERDVSIRLGDKTVSSSGAGTNAPGGGHGAEAGTGYFKKVFDAPFVNPTMGNITVMMSEGGVSEMKAADNGKKAAVKPVAGSPAWGAVYWQYFEELDRIVPPDAGPAALRLSKKLFVERNTDRGPVLELVPENGVLHVGDKLKIRIELHSDRDLEYVHMKDMRASCLEPVNVLSGYKWQGGLGYYESTGDIGTDFFFSWLPRGTYVFEYPVFVGQTGNFSNGVTSIECMYAPEFSFHSEGIRVNVETVNP